ncbi:Acyltransferase family protein [Selenomonas sp. GACV-9]|uniref:acyltransferase family protein n=1 Tax=Selenomonas sp. GACV-9 TaxID=3158782 RepID=UPI0008E3C045|nr:Acyltransferase family protein [Selenomonas ruminantium]
MLISGYCSANSKKINLSRLVQLIIQTSIFALFFRVVSTAINDTWSIKILTSLLPVNYYVILYVTLMLVAPYINITMERLSRDSLILLLFLLIMAFSVYPTAVDVLEECTGKQFMGLNSVSINGSIGGYSIINFMLIYVIGAAIRRLDLVGCFSAKKILVLWMSTIIGIYIWHLFLPKTGYNYCNPLVILEAATLFLVIARLNFRSKMVNYIAPAAFTCYLIHTSVLKVVGKYIAAHSSGWRLMLMLFTMVIGVYMLSIVMMKVWQLLVKSLYCRTVDKISIIKIREI